MNPAVLAIKSAKIKADTGVDYTPKNGAVCPVCGRVKAPVVTTRPWKEGTRIRFHKCPNPECLLSNMSVQFKSFQTDK